MDEYEINGYTQTGWVAVAAQQLGGGVAGSRPSRRLALNAQIAHLRLLPENWWWLGSSQSFPCNPISNDGSRGLVAITADPAASGYALVALGPEQRIIQAHLPLCAKMRLRSQPIYDASSRTFRVFDVAQWAVLSISMDGRVHWSRWVRPREAIGEVRRVCLSPDSQAILVVGDSGNITIFGSDGSAHVTPVKRSSDTPGTVAWAPSSQAVLVAAADFRKLTLIDTTRVAKARTLSWHGNELWYFCWTPDSSSVIALASANGGTELVTFPVEG